MTEVRWYWVAPLALIGIVTLCLIFRFRNKHWLRPIAVTAAGAIFSLFWESTSEDNSALGPILLTGFILTVATAAAGRK
jgi:hypothetical protein